jgi:peroxiredoxin
MKRLFSSRSKKNNEQQSGDKLQDQLDRIKERVEGNMSPRFLEIMHRATRDLIATEQHKEILHQGQEMIPFELENQKGERINSGELINRGPLVVSFYRGFWCPYCNADLAYLSNFMDRIKELGASFYAISPELPEFSRKIILTQKLNFDILHDPSNQLAASYGLKFSMAPDLMELYRDSFHINLKQYHGDDEWALPMPGRYVFDQQGQIRYAESCPDYRRRPEPDAFLEVLEGMAS